METGNVFEECCAEIFESHQTVHEVISQTKIFTRKLSFTRELLGIFSLKITKKIRESLEEIQAFSCEKNSFRYSLLCL